MAKLCDICGIRPATVRARVTTAGGESQILDLCEVDYRRLARQQRSSSPLESLFGGRSSLFEDFFGDDFFGDNEVGRDEADEARLSRPIPVRGRRSRPPTADVEDRLSGHAKELLQIAARHAADRGRRVSTPNTSRLR
jgi:ATP-dependent Clp protease ATP-binding subunit ClpC